MQIRYVDASELKSINDVKKAVLKNTVFGRVTPNQKRQVCSGTEKGRKDCGDDRRRSE